MWGGGDVFFFHGPEKEVRESSSASAERALPCSLTMVRTEATAIACAEAFLYARKFFLPQGKARPTPPRPKAPPCWAFSIPPPSDGVEYTTDLDLAAESRLRLNTRV